MARGYVYIISYNRNGRGQVETHTTRGSAFDRYRELRLIEAAGRISNLKMTP